MLSENEHSYVPLRLAPNGRIVDIDDDSQHHDIGSRSPPRHVDVTRKHTSVQDLLSQQQAALNSMLAAQRELSAHLCSETSRLWTVSGRQTQKAPLRSSHAEESAVGKSWNALDHPKMLPVEECLSGNVNAEAFLETELTPLVCESSGATETAGSWRGKYAKFKEGTMSEKFKMAAKNRQSICPASGTEGTAKSRSRPAVFMTAEEVIKVGPSEVINAGDGEVQYYSMTGSWVAVARSDAFQTASLFMVVLNVFWLGFDTDYNRATVLCNAPILSQIVNNLFCIAFVAELLVRFMAFEDRRNCCKDFMFTFDCMLTLLMVWETWVEVLMYLILGSGMSGSMSILRIFRCLRLTRVARMVRVLRQVPELMILLKGMAIACKSVCATLALLGGIVYVFAIIYTQQLAGTDAGAGSFDTVPQAVYYLLNNSVFTGERHFIEKMSNEHWVFYAITLGYLLLTSLTVMNMLIGVLCEVVTVTAKVEHEQMMMQGLKNDMSRIVPRVSDSQSEFITRKSFPQFITDAEFCVSLQSAGVDVFAMLDFEDFIFREEDELHLSEFIGKVVQLRGAKAATVKDIVDMRMFLVRELTNLQNHMGYLLSNEVERLTSSQVSQHPSEMYGDTQQPGSTSASQSTKAH